MKFSDRMIELAIQFNQGDLGWEPAAGHYVLDRERIVGRQSPFQEGVYFVLNFNHFMKLAGGIDAFRKTMIWLPTWEQAREILRGSGMSDPTFQSILFETDAIAQGNELTMAYELIAQRITGQRESQQPVASARTQ